MKEKEEFEKINGEKEESVRKQDAQGLEADLKVPRQQVGIPPSILLLFGEENDTYEDNKASCTIHLPLNVVSLTQCSSLQVANSGSWK